MKDPELRAREFDQAGLPYRYEVGYAALVDNPREVEQAAHVLLNDWHENKEWFKCSISTASGMLKRSAVTIYFESVTSSSDVDLPENHPETPPLRQTVDQMRGIRIQLGDFRCVKCDGNVSRSEDTCAQCGSFVGLARFGPRFGLAKGLIVEVVGRSR